MNHDDAVTKLIGEIEEQIEAMYIDMPDAEPGFEMDIIGSMLSASDQPASVTKAVRNFLL